MSQTRLQSAVEAIASTAFGFIIALLAQLLIMDHYGIPSDLGRDVNITIFFTAISLARGYAVRRFFNWLHHRESGNAR